MNPPGSLGEGGLWSWWPLVQLRPSFSGSSGKRAGFAVRARHPARVRGGMPVPASGPARC